MGAELLSSKIVLQEEQPRVRAIAGVPTAIGMSVGIVERGPIGTAVVVSSDPEFDAVFGSDIAAGYTRQSVRGFFQNGGQSLVFVRTVHYTSISNAASKTSLAATLDLNTAAAAPSAGSVLGSVVGPFVLASGDTLNVDIDAGGPVAATFTAAAAARTAANAGPYALVNGQNITVKINGGPVQTIAFLTAEFVAIGAATATEVAAVIAAKIVGASVDLNGGNPRITSDQQGTGSSVEVTGGTANGALGFAAGVVSGTGNVANIAVVSVAEVKTIVEAAVAGSLVTNVAGAVQIASTTVGVLSSVQVTAPSTADDELGLDNAVHSGLSGVPAPTLTVDGKSDGTYANAITILVLPASDAKPEHFNLNVVKSGIVVERWPNLSMDPAESQYVETVINEADTGSRYIQITDLLVNPSNIPAERPANSPGTPPVAFGPMTGGDDGLVGLVDNDFIGDDAAKTGLHAFDQSNAGNLLFVPDRVTPAVQNAMLAYAEIYRNMAIFCVLDSPLGLGYAAMAAYMESSGLEGSTEFGEISWPQIKILNPSRPIFGNTANIVVPASGHVAGMMARTDASRVGGVYEPPAGVEKGRIIGATGVEDEAVFEEAVRDFVAIHRVNPITKLRGFPIALDDSMVLKGGGNFPSISERRGVIFIEQSLKDGMQFARQRNNDEQLRDEMDRTTTGFLITQMQVGAFRTKDPETAFFVDTSEALNPPSQVFANKVNQRVGLATQKPSRFVILSFSQDTRALDEELAAAS